MRIVKAEQTCGACPSQWDAWTDDNQYVYLRYRHGYGYAKIYEAGYVDSGAGTIVAEFEHGHSLDGFITLEDFCKYAGIELDLGGSKSNVYSL
jgi:hypothetical protein